MLPLLSPPRAMMVVRRTSHVCRRRCTHINQDASEPRQIHMSDSHHINVYDSRFSL